jgi:hypothetical protein
MRIALMWQIAGRVLHDDCVCVAWVYKAHKSIAPCVSVDKSKIKRRVFLYPYPATFVHLAKTQE